MHLFVPLMLLPVLPFNPAYGACDEDIQFVNNETIIWPATITASSVVSEPLCILSTLDPSRRFCTNEKWEEQPACESVQHEPRLCPDHLIYFGNGNLCFTLLPAGPFDMECPHPNTYEQETVEKYLGDITTEFVWYPAITEGKFGTSEYYYSGVDRYYGTTIDINLNYEKPASDKKCLIYNYKGVFRAVSCNDTYTKLCAYHIYKNHVCEDFFPGNNCTQITFDTASPCICMTENGFVREDFCSVLAEFPHPYQNKAVTRILMDNRCWIGLEKIKNVYTWPYAELKLNYTFWAKEMDFGKDPYVALSENGWFVANKYGAFCALCQEFFKFKIPELHLSYNEENDEFLLEINAFKSLKPFIRGQKNKVYCFVYSGKNIKHRLVLNEEVLPENDKVLLTFPSEKIGPGYYQCEAFRYPDIQRIVSEEILVYDKMIYGNEYVAKITLLNEDDANLLDDKNYRKFEQSMLKYFQEVSFVKNLRRFAILKIDDTNSKLQLLLHITTTIQHSNEPDIEYNILHGIMKKSEDNMNFTLDDFSSSNFCYGHKTNENGIILTWSTTLPGRFAFSRELCLQSTGFPVWRSCQENFIAGSRWSEIYGNCIRNATKSNITDELHDLLESNMPLDIVLENLTALTEEFNKFQQIDVYLIACLLQKMTKNDTINLENVIKVVSNVMSTDKLVLVESQQTLDATDKILQSFDQILLNSSILENSSSTLITSINVNFLYVNLNKTIINGLALYQNSTTTLKVIDSETNIAEILQNEYLKAAVYLDNDLIAQINSANVSDQRYLIITLFMNDSLFNEKQPRYDGANKVFEVLLPKFLQNFSSPIKTFYKPKKNDRFYNESCAHWQFLTKEHSNSSYWMENSGRLEYDPTNYIVSCEFWHITHFGLLVTNKNIDSDILDVIFIVNSILSLCGLAVVFITSVSFKTWRLDAGNQILLNFTFSITFNVILLFLSHSLYNSDMNKTICIVIGAMLHYSVIAEFGWMFVISFLQYKRLVTVFSAQPQYLILKATVIGWFFPLIPVVVLLAVSSDNYIHNKVGICYPSTLGLYLALLTPVGIILLGNLLLFIRIAYDVCLKSNISCNRSIYEHLQQCKTMILLFFIFGLSWIFAFLSYLNEDIIFLHLFNFLTSIQGFVLFLFFILFKKTTRRLYMNLFKQNCSR